MTRKALNVVLAVACIVLAVAVIALAFTALRVFRGEGDTADIVMMLFLAVTAVVSLIVIHVAY